MTPTGVFELVFSRGNATDMGEGHTDADRAVATHAEIADIVEKDDAGDAAGIGRLTKQGADDDIGAARLVDDGGTERVVMALKQSAPVGEATAAKIRAAGDDHARRLAAGVRIDDMDASGGHDLTHCYLYSPRLAGGFLTHPRQAAGYIKTDQTPGRVLMAWRISVRISSRSLPTNGNRGWRTISVPRPVSADAILMYCTSLMCVSRCNSGVYQR